MHWEPTASLPGDRLAVLLELSRATEAGDPFAFQYEPQDYTLHTPGGGAGRAHLAWGVALLDDLAALRKRNPDPEVIQRVGEALRAFLTQSPGWVLHEAAIAEAVARGAPVSITLRFAAAELYALPWELCTLGAAGRRLGELPRVLLRYAWPETTTAAEQPSPRPEGGRVLVAWSAAGGDLPAAEHIRAIEDAARAGFYAFEHERDVLPHATYGRLCDALEAAASPGGEPIAVVHLLCHGGVVGQGFGLVLDGEDGAAVVVDAGRLRALFAEHAGRVRLVVLAACDSANTGRPGSALGSVAQAIHRGGVEAVVAPRFPLSFEGSVRLTAALYRGVLAELLSVEQAVLVARGELHRDAEHLDWAALTLHARAEGGHDSRPVVVRPYRGLLAFQAEHRRFFFGRDAEVAELCEDLNALIKAGKPRFLIVAGASGTGKTSMVLAGAVPRLLEKPGARWEVGYLRPGREPLAELDGALARRSNPTRRLLLVVDQLEEVFTEPVEAAAREGFMRQLWALSADAGSGIHVVLTLRVDFIGRSGELALNDGELRLDRVAYDGAHRVFVAQMERSQLGFVITGPAGRVGLELEPGLLERLLDDTGGEPGALPLLEDTLDLLWQRREGRALTQAAYDAIGGVAGALHGRADALIDGLDELDRRVARRLLVRLVSMSGDAALATRRRAPIEELWPSDAAEAERFARVLGRLVDERLLVRREESGKAAVEVAHEALIRRWKRLTAWVEEDRDKLAELEQVGQWVAEWRARGTLLSRGQIGYVEEVSRRFPGELGKDAQALLKKSQTRERAMQRRLRRITVVAVVAAVVMGVLGVIAWGQRKEALTQKGEAEERGRKAVIEGERARKASLMAGAREFLAHDQPGLATRLLIEVEKPEDTRGWINLAFDSLSVGIPILTLRGHSGLVFAARWSPDGRRIVTASEDNTARVWNADGKGKPMVLKGHEARVYSVAWSPDGQRIVTASEDKTARVWSADGQSEPVVLKGHVGAVFSAAWSQDGQRIVTASADKTARVWNFNGESEPVVLEGHQDKVWSAAWNPDGQRVVTVSSDATVRIWTAAGKWVAVVLRGHQDGVLSAAWSPDGQRIATVSSDNTARVWSAYGKGQMVVLKGHERTVLSAAWSPDGQRIVTASEDKTARVWSADGRGAPVILEGHEYRILSAVWSPDGQRIVTASEDKTARVWNADGRGVPVVLKGHEGAVWSAAWSPDGQRIVTGSEDNTVRVWNANNKSELVVFKEHKVAVRSAALSPDGQRIVTGSEDNTARVWSTERKGEPMVLRGHKGWIHSAAWSPDGRRIVTASEDKTARVWSADGRGELVVLKGHELAVNSAAWSPDGRRIVTASEDKTARVWNADGKGEPVVLKGHDLRVNSAAWSPDGQRIVTASWDETARVWNVDGKGGGGRGPVVLKGHKAVVRSAAWSPDGQRIVTASEDATVRVWDADGKGEPVVLKRHDRAVYCAAWSPDGRHIVTASSDETARVWNADGTGEPVVLKGHQDKIWSAAWSPDGQRIVTASKDRTVRIWSLSFPVLKTALREATTDCLSPEMRQMYLNENDMRARTSYEFCEHYYGRVPFYHESTPNDPHAQQAAPPATHTSASAPESTAIRSSSNLSESSLIAQPPPSPSSAAPPETLTLRAPASESIARPRGNPPPPSTTPRPPPTAKPRTQASAPAPKTNSSAARAPSTPAPRAPRALPPRSTLPSPHYVRIIND